MKTYNIKNQKGAISLFVMLAMMFFLIFVLGAYAIVSKRTQTQSTTLTELQSVYNKDYSQIESSKTVIDATEPIPVYNLEQFKLIGTNELVEVNGKIYKFGINPDDDSIKYQYVLRGNIIVNVDDYMCESNNITFLDFKFENAKYKIDKAQYDLYYYKDTAYWKAIFYNDLGKDSTETANASKYFTAEEKKNIGTTKIVDETNKKYSILNELDNYSYNGNFELLLMYNDGINGNFQTNNYNWWKQSVNPVKIIETTANITDKKVEGYETVKIYKSDENWGGLLYSNNSNTILDGSTYSSSWFYSVGIMSRWNNAMPGFPSGTNSSSKCALFARVDIPNENSNINTEVIPIKTVDQFKKIGSGENVKVDDKIYKFGKNEDNKKYYYVLQNNIIFNIDTDVCANFNEFEDFKFYSSEYKIDKVNFDLYYYKENKTATEKAYWKAIFYQDIGETKGVTTGLFTADERTKTQSDNPISIVQKDKNKFSILDQMDAYKYNSNYEFLLMYNDKTGGTFNKIMYNWWKQTTNPLKIIENQTKGAAVAGYTAIDVYTTSQSWGGLLKSNNAGTILDGSTYSSSWFYSVGTATWWTPSGSSISGIPGFSGTVPSSKCLLFMRVTNPNI